MGDQLREKWDDKLRPRDTRSGDGRVLELPSKTTRWERTVQKGRIAKQIYEFPTEHKIWWDIRSHGTPWPPGIATTARKHRATQGCANL